MRSLCLSILILASLTVVSCRDEKPQIPANKLPKDTTGEDLVQLNQDFVRIQEEMIDKYVDSLGLDMTKTRFGMRYEIKSEGYGDTVAHNDEVTLRYSISMLDGEDCDKLQNVIKTFPAGNGKVIKGIDEALKLMKVGGEGFFIFPSYLAYGVSGRGECIAPWSPVRCRIELIDCKKKK